MDWVADSSVGALRLRQMHDMKYQRDLNEKQSELTKIAFGLFNLKGDGKLTMDELSAKAFGRSSLLSIIS